MRGRLWASTRRARRRCCGSLTSAAGAGPYYPFTEYFDVVLADRSTGWRVVEFTVGRWNRVRLGRSACRERLRCRGRDVVPVEGSGCGRVCLLQGRCRRRLDTRRIGGGELVVGAGRHRRRGTRPPSVQSRAEQTRHACTPFAALPDGGWEDPQRLAGGDLGAELAVGADGSAVVVRARCSYRRRHSQRVAVHPSDDPVGPLAASRSTAGSHRSRLLLVGAPSTWMPRAECCWRGGTARTSWSDGAAPAADGADRASSRQASRVAQTRHRRRAARGEPTR